MLYRHMFFIVVRPGDHCRLIAILSRALVVNCIVAYVMDCMPALYASVYVLRMRDTGVR